MSLPSIQGDQDLKGLVEGPIGIYFAADPSAGTHYSHILDVLPTEKGSDWLLVQEYQSGTGELQNSLVSIDQIAQITFPIES